MIYMIDNYDSFTYNLVQLLGEAGAEIEVIRNDKLTPEELEKKNPDAILISPGPGKPKDAGQSEAIIEYFQDKCPILGVCLGHQAINEVFGGETIHAKTIMHGKTGTIALRPSPLFEGLGDTMEAARYHSLAANPETLPACLEVIAEEDGEIMALAHKDYPIYGVQFHPESILTPVGRTLLKNFLKIVEEKK